MTNVDLFPRLEWWNAPPDSPLPWLVSNPRCITRRHLDHLWLRIDDPSAALAARSYAKDGHLCLEVEGERFELEVSAGEAHCQPTDKPAELSLDHSALGSVYLGGIKPSVLHRAGVIGGDHSAALRADLLLSWPIAPWCPEVF